MFLFQSLNWTDLLFLCWFSDDLFLYVWILFNYELKYETFALTVSFRSWSGWLCVVAATVKTCFMTSFICFHSLLELLMPLMFCTCSWNCDSLCPWSTDYIYSYCMSEPFCIVIFYMHCFVFVYKLCSWVVVPLYAQQGAHGMWCNRLHTGEASNDMQVCWFSSKQFFWPSSLLCSCFLVVFMQVIKWSACESPCVNPNRWCTNKYTLCPVATDVWTVNYSQDMLQKDMRQIGTSISAP